MAFFPHDVIFERRTANGIFHAKWIYLQCIRMSSHNEGREAKKNGFFSTLNNNNKIIFIDYNKTMLIAVINNIYYRINTRIKKKLFFVVFVIVLFIRHVLTNGNDVRWKKQSKLFRSAINRKRHFNAAMISFYFITCSHSIDLNEFICLLGSSLNCNL